jgi:hypothetical protein
VVPALSGVTGTGIPGYLNAISDSLTGVSSGYGWGILAWGASNWSSADSPVGTVTPNLSFTLAALTATGSVGTVGFTGQTVALSGVSAAASVTSVAPSNTQNANSLSATGSVNSVTYTGQTVALSGVIATSPVGNVAFSGAALTGVSTGYGWGVLAWGRLLGVAQMTR